MLFFFFSLSLLVGNGLFVMADASFKGSEGATLSFGGTGTGSFGGGEISCGYSCEDSSLIPSPRENYKPFYNGCPSSLPKTLIDFTKCCNIHDLCYDTCAKTKRYCDLEFKRCLQRMCSSVTPRKDQQQCLKEASSVTSVIQMEGCQSYLVAQERTCECVEDTFAKGREEDQEKKERKEGEKEKEKKKEKGKEKRKGGHPDVPFRVEL